MKYGKTYADVAAFKKDFISENDAIVEEVERVSKIYRSQPKREKCKVCGFDKVNAGEKFELQGLRYFVCPNCGHINGEYEETNDFTRKIYAPNEGDSVLSGYYSEDDIRLYEQRMRAIYVPKANFLKEVFERENVKDYEKYTFLDIGSGSGYYVSAMRMLGLRAYGIEVAKDQVEYGNKMMKKYSRGESPCECLDETGIISRIQSAQEQVVSSFGVWEHVIDLNEMLDAIAANDNIQYIYFSVPQFCFAVILAAIHPHIFSRSLGGWHTHIFTQSSLQYIYKKYNWNVIDQWNFGADIPDLYRTMKVELEKMSNTYLSRMLDERLFPLIDQLQLALDKAAFCSEIHVLVKKGN